MFIPASIYSIPEKGKKYLTNKNNILEYKYLLNITGSYNCYIFEDTSNNEEKRVDLIFDNGKTYFSVESPFSEKSVEEYLISEI